MPYFYVDKKLPAAGLEVSLEEDDSRHAYRVLRLKPGDETAVSDGRGKAMKGLITVSEPGNVRVRLQQDLPSAESPLELILVQSLAKGEKMEQVIRQVVELGVKKVVPLATVRSVPRWDKGKEKKKIERWQSIIRSAAGQCRRSLLPGIEPLHDLESALTLAAEAKILTPFEGEANTSLAEVLKQPVPASKAVLLFIGPEGGFNNEEIEAIVQAGGVPVHLGPRILRTETAAVTAVSMIQAAWGDFA